MRHVQAHGLDCAAAGNLRRLRLLRFKRAGIAEFFQIGKHFAHGFARNSRLIRVFPALQRGRNAESRFVQIMDCSAFYIDKQKLILKLKGMNQSAPFRANCSLLPANENRAT